MRKLSFRLGDLLSQLLSIITGAAAQADGKVTTLNFAVTRNGEQIGSTTRQAAAQRRSDGRRDRDECSG